MLELYRSQQSRTALVTCRGRCEVLAESRYAIPVSKMGKSLRTAATSYIDVYLAVPDFNWIDPGRDDGRHPGHRAGLQVESRSVLRALDLQVEHLAAAEQEVLVRAHVVDRVEVAVLSVGQADLDVI